MRILNTGRLNTYYAAGMAVMLTMGFSGCYAADVNTAEAGRKKIEDNFDISLYSGYPDAFYAKQFTDKKTGDSAVVIFANYRPGDPDCGDDGFCEPNKIIDKKIRRYLSCTSMKYTEPAEEDVADMVYDGDSFTSCVTPEGKIYDGSVLVTGGFYSVFLYSAGFPEGTKDSLYEYDGDFFGSLAAQDTPSMEGFSENIGPDIPKGYILIPTFSFPVQDHSYVAKLFNVFNTDKLYGYQLFTRSNADMKNIAEQVIRFCNGRASIEIKDDRLTFSNCLSRQLPVPVNVSGYVSLNGKVAVAVTYSDTLPEDDKKKFDGEVQRRITNFKEQDF
jgi:hypothetical protein